MNANTTLIARTSRVARLCDGCHWTASLRRVATIGVGHRYLRHIAFPGADGNETGRILTLTECVACACERDSTAGLLLANACSTFCCGDVPCALPFKHGGDHECRRCPAVQNKGARS